jgi:4-carboxymuconolactone decarboxylase
VAETALALVRVSAALGRRDDATLESALRSALEVAAPQLIEEALLQSYLFLGFPAALEAFRLWRTMVPQAPAPEVRTADGWRARGAQVCAIVYGSQYEALLRNIDALQPELGRWMLEEGYGKVLGRPGLELQVRELCIAALLVAQPAPRQLYSHLRGALNAGAQEQEVEAALAVATEALDEARRVAAYEVWQAVRERRAAAAEGKERSCS